MQRPTPDIPAVDLLKRPLEQAQMLQQQRDSLLYASYPLSGGFAMMKPGTTVIDLVEGSVTPPNENPVDLRLPANIKNNVRSGLIYADARATIQLQGGTSHIPLFAGQPFTWRNAKISRLAFRTHLGTPCLAYFLFSPLPEPPVNFPLFSAYQQRWNGASGITLGDAYANIAVAPYWIDEVENNFNTLDVAAYGSPRIICDQFATKAFWFRVTDNDADVQLASPYQSSLTVFKLDQESLPPGEDHITISAGPNQTLVTTKTSMPYEFLTIRAKNRVAGQNATFWAEYRGFTPGVR